MSQLIKHLLVDRDTGEWITGKLRGYVFPKIKGLEVVYNLIDENEVHFCLSTAPDYFEYTLTLSADELTELQSDPDITIVSSNERQEEIPVIDPQTLQPTEETQIITVYDVTYRESHLIAQDEGLQILTQQQWDNEISSYDTSQEQKRLEILRHCRDTLLSDTDWLVIKSIETNVGLSTEVILWRQSLRDLPQNPLPGELPAPPEGVLVNQSCYDEYVTKIRSISMINDPLPPLPGPESPV